MSASAKTGALLVEARTEELPPQLLPDLANQFPDSLLTNLKRAGFADDDSHREQDGDGRPKLLATPRRVAALLKNIRRAAPGSDADASGGRRLRRRWTRTGARRRRWKGFCARRVRSSGTCGS